MQNVHILNEQNSVLNQFIREIRDTQIQGDQMRFQKNMERIGAIIGFEISKHLEYQQKTITTPLDTCKVNILSEQPVLATILRAGLALHLGLQYVYDKAPSAFISAYRKPHENHEVDIAVDYQASPSLQDKTLILSDPMLATGSSMYACYEALLTNGKPKATHVAVAIGSRQGLEYVVKNFPKDTHFWIAALDEQMNSKSYIVPGLGDAGDLAYGPKL